MSYILYFTVFKVATLCLDDSFSHSWHSLTQLHLECFSNSLEGDSVTCKAPPHHHISFSMLHDGNHKRGDHRSRLINTWWLEPKISNLDSSNQRTDFHRSNIHCSCFLAQESLFFLLVSFSSHFFAAMRP